VEVTDKYKVKSSNNFAASENIHNNVDINRAWKSIKTEYHNFRQRVWVIMG
jgi:hypothetical protein